MRKSLLLSFVILCFSQIVSAQFNSGSTGADGALDTATMTCPANECTVQLPESGVLNYTTVNIGSPRILVFSRNSRNTPVYLLAQGDVTVTGDIDVSGGRWGSFAGQGGGPGGFSGGGSNGRPGAGPGGGIVDGDRNGKWVGPFSLVPIVGGSGGANTGNGGAGLGGGGAIVIASSTSIVISGRIYANSGWPGNTCSVNWGSGGAIRLVANSIQVSGSLYATSQICFNSPVNNGVIRIEANNLVFTGGSNPLAISAPINPTIVPSAIPQLTFVSIGNSAVPSYSGSRFDLIDVLLPNSLIDPVPVVVSAQNIPVGTEVQIGFVSGSPNGTSTPCNLAGTFASSQCTAGISNLTRTGGTYLLATAVFTPPASWAKFNPKGRNYVAKVRLESRLGANQNYVFLNKKGREVTAKNLNPKFLKEFGM